MRKFKGRPITKETISLGTAGEIATDDSFAPPPKARVKFEAWAEFGNVKHKFDNGGGVHESLILTIDPETFVVLEIEEQAEQESLPIDGNDESPPDADVVVPIRDEA